jgi:hypothetical protein
MVFYTKEPPGRQFSGETERERSGSGYSLSVGRLVGAAVFLPATTTQSEHHFTAKEVAEAWNLSQDTIYRLFINEPGVVVLASERKKYRRIRRTLRIPESVKNRVYRRLQNVAR